MFRWMLPQRNLWIAHEHGGFKIDASTEGLIASHDDTPCSDGCSTEGLVAACEHHGPSNPFD